MWLAVLAGSLTSIPGVVGGSIRLTNNCPDVYVRPYAAATGIIPLANDTLVFLAIAWRLMKNANADKKNNLNPIKTGFKILAFGDYLLPLSKAVLQDGQAYYL